MCVCVKMFVCMYVCVHMSLLAHANNRQTNTKEIGNFGLANNRKVSRNKAPTALTNF